MVEYYSNMAIRRYTSCLFATVAVHAFYAQNALYHHMFLTVTILSILYHCTHEPHIHVLDKMASHVIFLLVLMDGNMVLENSKEWLLAFPACVVLLWWSQSVFPERSQALHACLHIVSVVGLHAFLHELGSHKRHTPHIKPYISVSSHTP